MGLTASLYGLISRMRSRVDGFDACGVQVPTWRRWWDALVGGCKGWSRWAWLQWLGMRPGRHAARLMRSQADMRPGRCAARQICSWTGIWQADVQPDQRADRETDRHAAIQTCSQTETQPDRHLIRACMQPDGHAECGPARAEGRRKEVAAERVQGVMEL
jgi:hypothetical protein